MKTWFQLVLVMLLWAVCFPLITIGISDAPHLSFAALRAVLAGGALLMLAGLLCRSPPRSRRTWAHLSLIGLGATTFGFLGMVHAAEFVSPGVATVIANSQPIMAALLAYFVLNERLGLHAKLGLFLGFLGVLLIALPGFLTGSADGYLVGIAYIVLAATGITVSNILIKRLSGTTDPLVAMGWQLVLGSIPLGAVAWATEDQASIVWSVEFVFSLLSLSLLGTALAYWLWCSVLARVELSRANVWTFLVPFFGLAIGVVLYGERLNWLTIAGIGATLLGIVLVNWTRAAATDGSSQPVRAAPR